MTPAGTPPVLPAAFLLAKLGVVEWVWYAFPIAEMAAFFISYALLWKDYRSELQYLGMEKTGKEGKA